MNTPFNLDRNEAEVVCMVLEEATNIGLPDLRPSEWGVVRSLIHRLHRTLEPETAVLTEQEPE